MEGNRDSPTYITVTLMVIKQLGVNFKGPYDFEQRVDNVKKGAKLIDVMEQAKKTGGFRYETQRMDFGAFVTSVNGRAALPDQGECWSLRDAVTGDFYKTGVSSYVPNDGERVLFKLDTYDSCGDSPTNITVTLLVIKHVDVSFKGPYDFEQRVVNVKKGSKLIDVMEQAKNTGDFRYETEMHEKFGAFVTSVMGVVARKDQGEYWSLRDAVTGDLFKTGVSNYVPSDGERVLFKLDTYDSCGGH